MRYTILVPLAAIICLLSMTTRRSLAAEGTAANPTAGKAVFEQNCVLCHGVSGRGDGPGSAALNPKPANFNDHERFSKIDHATRVKAVTEGGPSVGASPFMPPFKEVLTDSRSRTCWLHPPGVHALIFRVRSVQALACRSGTPLDARARFRVHRHSRTSWIAIPVYAVTTASVAKDTISG